jgi:hypothetical protein
MSKVQVGASTNRSKAGSRVTRGAAALALAALAASLLSGCVPSDSSGGLVPNADTNLYQGTLPAPAGIAESPRLPTLPRPPADSDSSAMQVYNNELTAYSAAFQASGAKVKAQAASIKKLVAETQKGGRTAVAAWESLLVTAGIAVAGADGKPVSLHGDTGSGWLTSDAELRVHSMLAASSGGMRLVDLADVLSTNFDMSKDDLANMLYKELYNINDRDFAAVYQAVGSGLIIGTKMVAVADVVLTWAQVELVMRRLATELEVASSRAGGIATAGYQSGSGPESPAIVPASYIAPRAAHRDCVNYGGPWSTGIVDQTYKSFGQVFDGIVEHYEEEAAKEAATGAVKKVTTSHMFALARLLLAAAALYAKASSLQAAFDMPNSPLVRTKDTRPGEVRDLNIEYTFNAGKWETVRACLNLMLGFVGIELPGTSPKPPSDMDVQLKSDDPSLLRIGDGSGKDTKVDSDETDEDGKVSFKLSGAPEGDRIPDQAAPDDKTVTVEAVNDLKSSNFFEDIQSVPWDAVDAAGSFGLSLLPGLLARSKFITFRYEVPVRDWKLSADFQVTAVGEVTEQLAYNEEFTGCGTTSYLDESIKGIGTFASESVDITAKLISNPEGNWGDQAFIFVPKGAEFAMTDAGQGDGVYMFPLPAHYTTEKSYSEPGTWKKPDVDVHQDTVCAYGGAESGGATPADDCGVRTYDATLQATMPKARHLYLAGTHATTSNLWKHCGDPLQPSAPPVAPTIGACINSKVSGGKVPSTADIFDQSKKQLEITGTMTCSSEGKGSIQQVDYNWTLQLCRIENGKPDC